jgi:hypothetical protein
MRMEREHHVIGLRDLPQWHPYIFAHGCGERLPGLGLAVLHGGDGSRIDIDLSRQNLLGSGKRAVIETGDPPRRSDIRYMRQRVG